MVSRRATRMACAMTVVHGWAPATRPSTRQSGLAPKAAGVAPPRRNVAVYSTNADPKYASEIRDLETRPLPSIDEALADSCLYDGPNIRDPTQQHPDDFELVNPWTAEDFEVHYAEGGHAPWITPKSVLLVYRSGVTSEEARSTSHEDHVVWIRTSNIISKSRPEEDVPYVWQSRLLLDDLDFPTCSLTALAGDFSAAVLLADSDPYKDCFLKTEFFQWTVSDDEYLRLDIFDRNQSPRCFLSFDAPGGRRLETREKHLSFLRKTRRTLFAGPLVRYSASGLEAAVCGSLVYAFHESEEQAVQWANADPYALALVLDPEKRCIAPYNDLDCTGAQTTSPYPLSDLPDPVLARLVERGLVASMPRPGKGRPGIERRRRRRKGLFRAVQKCRRK